MDWRNQRRSQHIQDDRAVDYLRSGVTSMLPADIADMLIGLSARYGMVPPTEDEMNVSSLKRSAGGRYIKAARPDELAMAMQIQQQYGVSRDEALQWVYDMDLGRKVLEP